MINEERHTGARESHIDVSARRRCCRTHRLRTLQPDWQGIQDPASLVESSADRKGLYRAGVYFPFGGDETTNEISIRYVGEAEEIYPRLQQHQDREFWSEALVFVSKDENPQQGAHLVS